MQSVGQREKIVWKDCLPVVGDNSGYAIGWQLVPGLAATNNAMRLQDGDVTVVSNGEG